VRSTSTSSATSTRAWRARTSRPFVTGVLRHGPFWLWVIAAMLAASVLAAALSTNWVAAAYVFLGAFTYGVVYTVWLKRRTWWNIVVGGLAEALPCSPARRQSRLPRARRRSRSPWCSFSGPRRTSGASPSSAGATTRAAGVPMLPVVVGDARAAKAICASAWLLVLASLVPAFIGLHFVYAAFAGAGGAFFLVRCHALVRRPGRMTARRAFLASLVQLSAVLLGAMADVALF
jgi:protoheme IX farnesyltransferase